MTRSTTIFVALLGLATAAVADPHLPAIFGSNMVLQRIDRVPVWGTADPSERIDVEIAGQHRLVYAGRDGSWQVEFRNLPAGTGHTMVVKGKQTLTFDNVAIGDVWLASGQSNMEWAWSYFAPERRTEVGKADLPDVRLFLVTKKASGEPVSDVQGQWVVCNSETMKGFSLVAFYFARAIHLRSQLPIGVIGSYWGGTPAEAWTRMSALESTPETKPMADHYRAIASNYTAALADYEKKLAEWNEKARFKIEGNRGLEQGWNKQNFDDTTWATTKLPGSWEQSSNKELDIDGVAWFRKQIVIPAEWANRDLILELGPIDDEDITYFNGEEVGKTGSETPNSWQKPRVYTIPARLVKAGSATISVRVLDSAGTGGVTSGPMTITPDGLSSGPLKIDGEWRFAIEAGRPTLPQSFWNSQPQQPYGPGSAVAPTNLWNGMIHPLIPYAIKGVIWYQGESNAARAYQYRTLFPTMIKDWRQAWGRPNLPFYFVQLANFMARKDEPSDSEWAELREAQTMTLRLPNTGMAVAIDIGEAGDIHPRNKLSVGERLARIALNRDYGFTDVVFSGPTYKSMRVEGNRLVVEFDSAEGGLATLSGQRPMGFAIAGADRKFVWADAKVVGNKVYLSSPSIANPVAARYAWADNPVANMINLAGLPAVPFRTDDWPGLTVDRR